MKLLQPILALFLTLSLNASLSPVHAAEAVPGIDKPIRLPEIAIATNQNVKGPEVAVHAEKLAKSLETWKELKAKCGSNYSYKIRFSSWTGFGNETTIVVSNNKVTERKYTETPARAAAAVLPGQVAPKPVSETWTERAEELGTHKKGAALKTLDDLYVQAQKILETKLRPTHRLYVSFDKQGLLLSCFYVDTNISDDAPRTGVMLNSLQLEAPEK